MDAGALDAGALPTAFELEGEITFRGGEGVEGATLVFGLKPLGDCFGVDEVLGGALGATLRGGLADIL